MSVATASAAATVGTSRERLAPPDNNENSAPSALERISNGVSLLTRWLSRSGSTRQRGQQQAEIEAEEGSRFRRRSSFFQKLHMGDHEMTPATSAAADSGGGIGGGESGMARIRTPFGQRLAGWLRQSQRHGQNASSLAAHDSNNVALNTKTLPTLIPPPSESFAYKFVVDTSQTFYYNWLAVVSAAFSYNLVFIIARSVFTQLQETLWVWLLFDYLTDLVNLVDMFLSSRTGVLDQGLMITDLSRLRRFYRRTVRFKMDVLSILPTDLLYLVPQISTNGTYVRANRLLKFGKFLEFFDRTEARTNFPNLFRALNLMMYILVIFHWNACIYFAFSLVIGLGSDSWTYPMRPDGLLIDNTDQFNLTTEMQQLYAKYLYSFYWSALTLTAVAEIPRPVTLFEYIFETIVLLVGILIFAIIIGSVGSMVSNISAASTEFQQRMDGAKRYMEFRKVGKALEHRVLRWFDYLWENKQSLDEENILGTLPDKLKAEVAIHVHFDTLKRVAIFQDCEPGLLVELVLKLKLQVFSPGDYICRKGDIGKEMYIVKRGKLSVVSPDGKTVFVTLGEGSVFGEVSILNIPGNKTGNRRTANVRSDGYSDLFCLSKTDLWDALTEYPDAKVKLLEKGQQVLRKDNLIDEAVLAKALRAQETMEQKSQRLEEDLESFQVLFSRTQSEFDATQGRLKRRIARLEMRRLQGGAGGGGDEDSSGEDDKGDGREE